jgi:digeranylgeranylglycerophospholipid reductase
VREQHFDILIIGGGPAGTSAAARAAAAGARVAVIEARREIGQPVQCAEFVPALLAETLPWLGEVTVQPIRRMRTFVAGGAAEETASFPGFMIDRGAFDARLAAEAARCGARLFCGRRVVAVELERGRVATSRGEVFTGRVLIGADGPRSLLGAATGRVNRDLVETRQIAVALHAPQDATDIFLDAAYPGGYAWLFPKRRIANLGLGVEAGSRALLREGLRALHARLVAEGVVGDEVLGFTGGAIPVGGRQEAVAFAAAVPVVLAGDAAGLANPTTGAGIAAAVLSGGLAGEAAAAWLEGRGAAFEDLEEELGFLFDPSLARALRHRRHLLGLPDPLPDQLRAGWIGDPRYWQAQAAAMAEAG